MTPRRVLIVDDVAVVRRELSLLLSLSGEITVVGEAADGLDAVRQAQSLHPDVVLIDLEMPVLDGFQAARRIKMQFPECHVIALSIHDSPESREECIRAGMDEFVPKGACIEDLLEAIRCKGGSKEGDER